jgi:hypothetical protein
MKEIVEKEIQNIDLEIKNIDIYGPEIINNALRIIQFIQKSLAKLRELIIDYKFPSIEDEILFFKILKPKILSRLLFFNKIFCIESMCPNGSFDIIQNYLNEELNSLTFYFNKHLTFYQYYRSDSTIHDECYFVRGHVDIRMCIDSISLFIDTRFSTIYDYKVAKILANEKVRIYLNKKLMLLLQKKESENEIDYNQKAVCQWTGKKNALVEIGYAFHSAGDINNGNADIKEIMNCLGNAFNIDLGDYYRTYITLKDRKKDQTQYLNQLTEKLLKRMDEDDK